VMRDVHVTCLLMRDVCVMWLQVFVVAWMAKAWLPWARPI
jgi:hypothetical protein